MQPTYFRVDAPLLATLKNKEDSYFSDVVVNGSSFHPSLNHSDNTAVMAISRLCVWEVEALPILVSERWGGGVSVPTTTAKERGILDVFLSLMPGKRAALNWRSES